MENKIYSFNKNWTEKQFFIYACFVDDLQKFYNEWILQSKGRIQFFNLNKEGKLVHKYWNPSERCSETSEILTSENIDIKIGYWNPFVWKPIRKDLKNLVMREEAFACQSIDFSCNDCIFLERVESLCKKYNKNIKINENMSQPQNKECFEHRRKN